jgi:hypothetical protein
MVNRAQDAKQLEVSDNVGLGICEWAGSVMIARSRLQIVVMQACATIHVKRCQRCSLSNSYIVLEIFKMYMCEISYNTYGLY